MPKPSHHALVIGGSSTIAKALIKELSDHKLDLVVISQKAAPLDIDTSGLQWITTDYSETNISNCCKHLASKQFDWRFIFICNGILHTDQIQPEKRLEDMKLQSLQTLLRSNAIIPALWLQQLTPLLSRCTNCCVAVFSARVGSISDNRLGGWYSYRASKAALNMLLKTAAIELARRAKGIKLIAFHPGTTDTPLSKPFQKNINADKLFSPTFVAKRLLDIMQNLKPDGEISYLDWDNKPIAW